MKFWLFIKLPAFIILFILYCLNSLVKLNVW